MTGVQFQVVGHPVPQGSKTRMPNGAMVEGRSAAQRESHRNWRSAVAEAARDAMTRNSVTAPLDGPLGLYATFRFPRPKSWPKKRGEWHTTSPDLDKVIRATGDALTAAGLIVDDRLFCVFVVKAVVTTRWTGASIAVHQLIDEPFERDTL